MMTNYFSFITMLLLSINVNGQIVSTKAAFPGIPTSDVASFVVDGKAYVGLGYDDDDNYLTEFWRYDPKSNSWSQIQDFPGQGREGAFAFVVDGKAYVGCGRKFDYILLTAEYYRDFYQYDPGTESWSQIVDFPDKGRYGGIAWSFGNKAYVGTGDDEDAERSSFYSFENGSWGEEIIPPDFFYERQGAAATVMNGKGYVIAGTLETSFQQSDITEFDPVTETFTELVFADGFNLPFDRAPAFNFEDEIYTCYGLRDFVTKYNVEDDEITNLGDLFSVMGRRINSVAFEIDGTAYFGLGWDGSQDTVYTDLYSFGRTTSTKLTGDIMLKATPNPSNGLFHISGTSIGRVNIYDAKGVYLGGRPIIDSSLDLQDLPSGTYIIKGSGDRDDFTQTIIVN